MSCSPRAILLATLALSLFATSARSEGDARYGISARESMAAVAAMPAEERERIVREFSLLLNQSMTIMHENHFLGIKTWQNPFDVWVTQEIISETRPDVILETGTFRGGSSLMWAMYLLQVNPEGRVITIDIADKRVPKAKRHPLAERVEFLQGSSTAPEIVAAVRERTEGKRVLVILDSLHTAEHVAGELAAYADLVPPGGYVIVQDTPVGAIDAVHEFVAARDDWEIDHDRERLLYTVNKDGFLRRRP